MNRENIGLALVALLLILGLLLPGYKLHFFIAGFITLFSFAIFMGFKKKRRKFLEVGSATRKSIICNEILTVTSSSICISDNWELNRVLDVEIPTGEYAVLLELLWEEDQCEIASIVLSLKNASGGAFKSQLLEISVDSGFVIITDKSFTLNDWNVSDIRSITKQMFNEKSNTRHRFIADVTGRPRGIVAISGTGDGKFSIVCGRNTDEQYQFRIDFF